MIRAPPHLSLSSAKMNWTPSWDVMWVALRYMARCRHDMNYIKTQYGCFSYHTDWKRVNMLNTQLWGHNNKRRGEGMCHGEICVVSSLCRSFILILCLRIIKRRLISKHISLYILLGRLRMCWSCKSTWMFLIMSHTWFPVWVHHGLVLCVAVHPVVCFSSQQSSIDGILQWTFHNISRPLPDSQGYYQWPACIIVNKHQLIPIKQSKYTERGLFMK